MKTKISPQQSFHITASDQTVNEDYDSKITNERFISIYMQLQQDLMNYTCIDNYICMCIEERTVNENVPWGLERVNCELNGESVTCTGETRGH